MGKTDYSAFMRTIENYLGCMSSISNIASIQSDYYTSVNSASSAIKSIEFTSWSDEIGQALASHKTYLTSSYNAIKNSVENNMPVLTQQLNGLMKACSDFEDIYGKNPNSSIFDTQEDKTAWNNNKTSELSQRGKNQLSNWYSDINTKLYNKKLDIENYVKNIQGITFNSANISNVEGYQEASQESVPAQTPTTPKPSGNSSSSSKSGGGNGASNQINPNQVVTRSSGNTYIFYNQSSSNVVIAIKQPDGALDCISVDKSNLEGHNGYYINSDGTYNVAHIGLEFNSLRHNYQNGLTYVNPGCTYDYGGISFTNYYMPGGSSSAGTGN